MDAPEVEIIGDGDDEVEFHTAEQSISSEVTDLKNECAVGHRVHSVRSILALVLDKECVFAGLQGGDIVVCAMLGSRSTFPAPMVQGMNVN